MARASNRISRPSRSTEWLRTLPSPPRQIIGHTSWRRLNGEYIVIEWEPLEKANYNLVAPLLFHMRSCDEDSPMNCIVRDVAFIFIGPFV